MRWGYVVVMLVLLILAFTNSYLLYRGDYLQIPTIRSFLAKEILIRGQEFSFSLLTQIFQWLIILIIEILLFSKIISKIKEKKLEETYVKVKENHGKFNTELDSLYSVIKEHNEIKLEQIAKAFKINPEKALEWVKILENNNLVTIEYPAFSSPVVIIKNEKK